MPKTHYEIYQDNMVLKMHGFPQFSADPEGNTSLSLLDDSGNRRIEIGDLGYFQ